MHGKAYTAYTAYWTLSGRLFLCIPPRETRSILQGKTFSKGNKTYLSCRILSKGKHFRKGNHCSNNAKPHPK